MKRHRIIRTRGQRIAWTNTSHIPDAEVVEALKFVATEVDLDRTVVHFKHGGTYRRTGGVAYPSIPRIANLDGLDRNDWRYLIVVTDASWTDHTWRETLAHEAKHVEQFREGTRVSEVACGAFEDYMERKWLTTS